MIDYGNFQFACPPEAGETWFYQTLQWANAKYVKVDTGGIYVPFPEERNGNSFRVTTVRNPCDWLAATYQTLRLNSTTCLPKSLLRFAGFSTTSLKDFIFEYLQKMPGEASRTFLSYKADSYIRIEDMPWAMIEFLEMFGYRRPNTFPRTTILQLAPTMGNDLWRQVIEAEKEMCDAFEYY